MAILRLSALAAALVLGPIIAPDVRVTLADEVPPCSSPGVCIDNGTVQLGINPEGHLNVPGGTLSMADDDAHDPGGANRTTTVGLRYIPTNGEATAHGFV